MSGSALRVALAASLAWLCAPLLGGAARDAVGELEGFVAEFDHANARSAAARLRELLQTRPAER